MATIKFAVHGNSTTAYLNSGAGNLPLIADINQGGPPTVVADATAIGGQVINFNGGSNVKGLIYPGYSNSQQTGIISVLARIAPQYSGSPSANSSIISVGGPRLLNSAAVMLIQVDHFTTGNLVVSCTDMLGGGINFTSLGAWSPVSGTYYDIVVTYTGGSGANALKVYVDGVLFGQATVARTWTAAYNVQSSILLGIGQNQILVGTYKLNEYVIWDYVIDPTSGGLNLNGAGRSSFVSTSGLTLNPNASADPGIANVRLAQAYTIAGVALTGTAAIPTAAQVLTGVPVDATVGTVVQAAVADVRKSTTYGPSNSLTGLAYIPAASNVKLGVNVDQTTGTLQSTDPGQSNVLTGTAYIIESVAKTGTLAPATNTLTQAVLIGQASPGTSSIVLVTTQGDSDVFNLKCLDGPDGNAFDLSFATFSTTMKGTAGDVIFGNSQHTANPDQVGHKGEFTLTLSTADTESLKIGALKEIVTEVTQGASVVYFHGRGVLTVIKKEPIK